MLMKVAVPCKDFADGHCPYGDYCSFIQYLQDDQKKVKAYDVCSEDKKPESIEAKSSMTEIEEGDERNEVQPQGAPSRSLKHRKSASTSNLSAWAKSLPKTDLLPFVKWDEEVLEKQKRRLSAFAPPFLQVPLVVDEKGELVSDSPETLQVEIAQEPESVSTSVEPPKASARSKGPPASLQPSLKIDRKDEQNHRKATGNGRRTEAHRTEEGVSMDEMASHFVEEGLHRKKRPPRYPSFSVTPRSTSVRILALWHRVRPSNSMVPRCPASEERGRGTSRSGVHEPGILYYRI